MSDREEYLINMESGFFHLCSVFFFFPFVLHFSKFAKMKVCQWERDRSQDVHH